MKVKTVVVIFFASAVLLRADQMIENVQQALKDQGFYYGEISGEKNADTSAAIRRFQIRNGLQITGELNDETLRALGVGSGPQSIAKTTPAPTTGNSDLRSESPEKETPANPARVEESAPSQVDGQVYSGKPVTASAEDKALFAGPPYER